MTIASRFLILFPRILLCNGRARNRCAAIGVFCAIAFLDASAWGQGLFIYRDLNTGITSDVRQALSLRFMRHIWTTNDTAAVLATVVQKGGKDGHGLVLYKSLDEGGNWTLERVLSSATDIVSDGVLDSNNNILIATSLIGATPVTNVDFIRLIYEPASKSWAIDPMTPVTVFASVATRRASRATISVDSKGVIWCAYRWQLTLGGIPFFQVKVSYSADGGYTWVDSGNRFGTPNTLAQKSAKVISLGSRTAVVFQDQQFALPDTNRYKSWAYRDDNQPLGDSWTSETISLMVSAQDDTLGSHWSLAADDSGNLHLSYQDAGIRYLKYDASAGAWQAPVVISTSDATYNSISVAGNYDLYLFCRFGGTPKVFCKQYSVADQRWGQWLAMSAGPHPGYLRMSSTERFGDRLPMLYEKNALSPYEVLYVLFDTSALTACQ
jgi:hypothetical protein